MDKELEPAAEELLKAGATANDVSERPALYSIAISLKRIADAMTKVPVMAKIPEDLREEWEKANEEMIKSGQFVQFMHR